MKFVIPYKLYSYRDLSYEAKLFQLSIRELGVKKLRTTSYNAKENGLTEKGNEFIKNHLASCSESNKQKWDLWCKEVVYAYNSSIHSSTGYTPTRLMFGIKYRIPIDIMFSTRTKGK